MAMLAFSILEGTTTVDPGKARIVETRWEGPIAEIARGDAWGCMDITEPGAGSDLAYSIVGGNITEKELQPGDSFQVVVRSAPNEIKAYYNACLHRGRQLKDHSGRCTEFRCPFHGFSWTLDGALQQGLTFQTHQA